jgi:acyl dehydratase
MKYLEDFKVGEKYVSKPRLVTDTDVALYSIQIGALNPLYLKDDFAKKLGFKAKVVPGPLTLILTGGLLSQLGLFDGAIMVGIRNVSYKKPIYHWNEIQVEAEIIEKRKTKKPGYGIYVIKAIVKNLTEGYDAVEAEFVMYCQRREP